jgi:hypothetical protein
VQQRRVEHRKIDALRADQKADFGTTEDHAVGAARLAARDDVEIEVARTIADDAAQLVEDSLDRSLEWDFKTAAVYVLRMALAVKPGNRQSPAML